jgi:hypothetical protein
MSKSKVICALSSATLSALTVLVTSAVIALLVSRLDAWYGWDIPKWALCLCILFSPIVPPGYRQYFNRCYRPQQISGQ